MKKLLCIVALSGLLVQPVNADFPGDLKSSIVNGFSKVVGFGVDLKNAVAEKIGTDGYVFAKQATAQIAVYAFTNITGDVVGSSWKWFKNRYFKFQPKKVEYTGGFANVVGAHEAKEALGL